MSQPSGLATRRVNLRVSPARRSPSIQSRRVELEGRLEELQKNVAELHTAIFEAAQVHRRLCAPRLVRSGSFEIASEIFAVRHLAGDFFTVKDVGNRAVLALGDICGKGLAAGMWTTHLVSLVGARAAVNSDPEAIVAGVNRDVCLTASLVPLASLFAARLDSVSGRLEYCSAGHPPALLLRANGELESLSEGGLLLGVVPNAPYVRGSIDLGPGDVLVAYSDGVLETVNSAEEEFGLSRIKAQLCNAAMTRNDSHVQNKSAESLLFSVLAAVQDFAGSRPLVDDLSLVVIRRDSYV
jgi:sigma-B regulation protein RsbU (phosphoserine phosphatase)